MKRREFIGLLGAATALPLTARAQQSERVRRIGVLMSRAATDPEGQARLAALRKGLQQVGLSEGRDVQIDIRWSPDDPTLTRQYAADLVALSPDVILTSGSLGVAELQRATRIVPILFAVVADPVGAGFVDSLSRPGGNTRASCWPSTVSAGSGWSFSSRSRPRSRMWASYATPTSRQAQLNLPRSRLRHRHSELR